MKVCIDCGKEIEGWLVKRCPNCEARYKAKIQRQQEEMRDELHRQQINRMRYENEFPWYCEYCGKRFRTSEECDEHEYHVHGR
jgi:hypothetical protein